MAASDTTRLLVLGVARLFGPANGYQLRRELLSWRVDTWANVNPGSIYSMLSTLTGQGFLERFDISATTGSRPVAVYRATAAGEAELLSLIKSGLTAVEPFDLTGMYAALSLSPSLLERDEVIAQLRVRLGNLDKTIAMHEAEAERNAASGFSPPHVSRMFGLPITTATAERTWLQEFIDSVLAGDMMFASDDWSQWDINPADPGWRMVAERRAYLEQIDGAGATA
jgi:DNA-binding PadR family transcriptional regulator